MTEVSLLVNEVEASVSAASIDNVGEGETDTETVKPVFVFTTPVVPSLPQNNLSASATLFNLEL